MIKGINSGSGLQVNNGYFNWPQFYNSPNTSGNTLIGQVRYNGSSQCFEVYDGNSWIMMQSSYPTIELSGHVQAVISWAQGKMTEEARIKELATKHPTVADALQAVARAEEQVKIAVALCDVS